VSYIDTRGDVHHELFAQALKLLDSPQLESLKESLPFFVSSPYTGRFREWDEALLNLQLGLLGAQNPFYPGVDVRVSPKVAERILGKLGDLRAVFEQLAKRYKDAAATSELTTS
jgi:hypothetical protein